MAHVAMMVVGGHVHAQMEISVIQTEDVSPSIFAMRPAKVWAQCAEKYVETIADPVGMISHA